MRWWVYALAGAAIFLWCALALVVLVVLLASP